MSGNIYAALEEYEKIEAEIKRITARRKQLKARYESLKETVLQYLDDNDRPGIKNPRTGFVVHRRETKRTRPKKKDERRLDCIRVLREHGITDADPVFEALESARKGETYTDYKLK